MSGNDGIFSIRLVIADFYMEKPVAGLDPCYSEFRSKEIKKVPIIRIFGSNAQGQKTCMHVHGVFPYFYIPYDQKDFESLNKAIYQIAINLDRAINISLSQGNSAAQHVFKVQLVKGIPFYGYHRSEHQFLKIYMFNPRFVRRAANLLQNGAIMDKNFHPHESHVPYILQFMIDYNLYGMSSLHVPLEVVKFRRSNETAAIPFRNVQESQILDCNLVKKISCSSLEVDIASSFILNRFQIVAKSNSAHTNPGIESIWNDERLRRQKLAKTFEDDEEKLKTIPPLEIPSTQGRPNVHSTESEIFYRTALLEKLVALETSSLESSEITDQTINCTLSSNTTNISTTTHHTHNISLKAQKRTFNLTKILQNSVYPEECSQHDNLINASVIQNHLTNNNIFQQSMIYGSSEESKVMEEPQMTPEDESVFLDNTIIDEELVLSLTQNHHTQQQQTQHVPMNATLREEDMELLDILQQLEENNEDKIDLDSSLAPLSQAHQNFALSPQQLDKETTASVMPQSASDVESEEDNENDNVHDFSVALESLDDLILKLTQTQQQSQNIVKESLPQIDGSDDVPKTPTKASTSLRTKSPPRTPTTPKNRRATLGGSPSRSPRTPKTGHKYAPLPLAFINRSTGKKSLPNAAIDTTPSKVLSQDNLTTVSLRKKLALSELRRKSISVVEDVPDHSPVMAESSNTTKRRSKRFKDLDKTHVTCALTPRRTNDKLLKVYSVDQNDAEVNEVEEDETEVRSPIKTDHKSKNDIPAKTLTEVDGKKLENATKTIKKNKKRRGSKQIKVIEQKATLDTKELQPQNEAIKKGEANNFLQLAENVNTNVESNVNKKIFNNGNTDASETTDEEILNSDAETENSIKHLKKTPNLKRLRRSFLATRSAKRRRLTIKNQYNIVNSFKFENPNEISNDINKVQLANSSSVNAKSISEYENPDNNLISLQEIQSHDKNSVNTKIPIKIKKCCIKLRKLPIALNKVKEVKGNVQESKDIEDDNKARTRSKNKSKILKDSKISEHKTNTKNNQEFKNVHKIPQTLEKLGNCQEHLQIDQIEIAETESLEKLQQQSEIFEIESLEHPQLSDLILDSSDLNQSNKTDSFEKLQLSSASSKTFVESNVSPNSSSSKSSKFKNLENSFEAQISSLEVTQNSSSTESSDEEITETPPKEDNLPKPINLINKSLPLHSPVLFTQNSSPIFLANAELQKSKSASRSNSLQSQVFITLSSSNEAISNAQSTPPLDAKIVLTPLDLPPTRNEVLKGCHKLQLPEFEFQRPFYSNPDDITKHKELGFTILQIPGNKLNDTEEFQSILGAEVKGLSAWRREKLLQLAGPEVLNKYRNAQRIREYLALPKMVAITPQINAPTRQETKLWLKARELIKSRGEKLEDDPNLKTNAEDSPIKIRRQKVTMMLNGGGEGDSDGGDNTLDCSLRSLTLTPLTPGTPVVNNSLKDKLNESFTPVTTKIEKIPLKYNSALRKHRNLRVLRRVSLTRKLKEAAKSENSETPESSSQEKIAIKESQESVIPNSQASETSVSSQTALQELERSSFMRNLQQHDVTIGGLTNESSINNTFGFKVALENLQQAKADVEFNYLTMITLEVFVATRDDLYPNPEIDELRCLFYAIENSIPNDHMDRDKMLPRKACGYIMVHDSRDIVAKEGRNHGIDRDIEVTIVQTEVEALEALLGLCSRWDPDIYAGYEIEMSSWGFVIERAKHLCLNIAPLLSRVPTQKVREFVDEDRESFTDLDAEMKLCGRILLDVWRLLRSEIALTSYTFENVMYHIMHKRCPWHSYRTLTEWYASPCSRWIVLEYYLERVRGTLCLLDQLDLIGRTSEMAKLIGIQFYEVLSRGSQFRVESMMLRIAKPKNLVPLSPSVQQRAHMRAPEYLALILEPQSRFYADPVIVLDFQSLYPSMIIGYNYCFSTCLGRVEHLGQSTPFEFGASQLRVSPSMLRKLVDRDLITISPCGVVFVKASVREGILPRMLTEILDTRQMVKQSMKLHKSNSALQRILHSRQLGLKLMANVTYGYTAANFSGRMPSVEVGDTVVSKGRETLERAIKMVEANEKWNVKVVYGDTDSMFVLVPGRNREEAFRIGEEIADAVTKQNPHPVKLKLEKVYQPCILQTKKRYVGYMYETADQNEPVYEAKGIETVRRDGCPLVAKMLEKVLRILFESADVSQVKQYVCRHFTKLLSGRANLQDLIFAKEFRGLNGYKPTACVPSLELTRKWIQNDPRRIPRKGERVPFIITNGPPGVPLIRLIRHPHEVLADEGLKINAIYYITKAVIPPLNRCLLLIGADVHEWFASLPRKVLLTPALSVANEVISCPNNTKSKKSTISQFFSTTNCIVDCGRQTKQGICSECNRNPTRTMVVLQSKISKIERSYLSTQQICQSCCGRVGDLNCGSLNCPVLYVSENKRRDLQQIIHFRNLLEELF